MANKEFYRFAEAYDIAFSGRDYRQEAEFIEWCFNQYAADGLPKSVLELACGPARHAVEFSKMNWNTSALDLSSDMIDYAKIIAQKEKADIKFICGDMIEYELENPVSVTAIFTESITHILTNEDFIRHLKTVSAGLLPGGLYIIETAHPVYFFPDGEDNIWKVKKNGKEVEVVFGLVDDEYDSFLQQWNLTTRISVKERDKSIQVNQSKSKHRWYLAQELKALVQLSGEFEDVNFFGNMNIPPGKITNSKESDCMVVVMRKKQD